ncbi:MAG: HAD family hydrolase [Acidimicrobiales bacterium]
MDVAAFDFDGTLTDGGSVFGFLSALAGRPAVVVASAAMAPQLALAALAGGTRADRTKERLFQRVLAGTEVGRLAAVAARYGQDHVATHLRTDVRDRLDWHRRRGDRVVIVSASPEVYVREAADHLGADGLIATRLEVAGDGTVTGRYDGANCRGDEKLRRLRRWIEESGATAGQLWCYGNSRGDLTMLRAADVGVNVGRLGRMGPLRAYPGLHRTGPEGPTG